MSRKLLIRPQYDRSGAFLGFSMMCRSGDWTMPQTYKRMMLAHRDSASDVLTCEKP